MRNNKLGTKNEKRTYTVLFLIFLFPFFVLTSCGNRAEEVHFSRFEQLLFDTPASQLQAEMEKRRAEFDSELLFYDPEVDEFMEMTQDFVADPVMRQVYEISDSLYHDLGDIERNLGKALGKAYKLCPDMEHIRHFYTMVTGDFDNYHYRVFSNSSDICIAIDIYSLGAMERFQYFGMPNYLVQTFTRNQIVPDCMRTLASLYKTNPETPLTLLDQAVSAGKITYFVEQTVSGIADTTLLRYSKKQMQWMEANVQNVWSWIIQNNMLYSTDQSAYRNLMGDAPHTNAFGNESAPRTIDYIGWQIVRQYMKKSGATMQELFNETDSQKILNISGWRP